MITTKPLSFAVVGCGGPGKSHARAADFLDEYALCAGCDLDEEALREFETTFPGTRTYVDLDAMLEQEKPDVVAVATGAVPRAAIVMKLARAGVKGIYAEKPMAVGYGEAKAMLEACQKAGTALAINHQRRMLPVYTRFRELLDAGAVGEIQSIQGSTPGDFLSDGTHLIDCIRHLLHDRPAKWVFGQVYRDLAEFAENARQGKAAHKAEGTRFGHLVENGATALLEFEGEVRVSLQTGSFWQPKRHSYTHIEVHGTRGCLVRPGDRHGARGDGGPELYLLNDEKAGWQEIGVENGLGRPEVRGLGRPECYGPFAKTVLEGAPHPLSGENALQTHELVMAVYEAARLRRKVYLPLAQEAYPLDLMEPAGSIA